MGTEALERVAQRDGGCSIIQGQAGWGCKHLTELQVVLSTAGELG